MKLWKIALPLVVAVAALGESAFAGGGFLQKLPKDGTWVEYNVEMKAEKGPMQESTGTMKLKSVGTAKENGETYRWFEIEFAGEQNGMKQHTVMKVLVGEKGLKAGAKGPLKFLRGWQKNQIGENKMDPKELTEAELSAKGPIAFFFGLPLKNVKTVKDARTIVYQKGDLKVATATAGDADFNPGVNAPKDFKQSIQQRIWRHKSIPTGVAAMEMRMEVRRKDELVAKMKMTFKVQDYGKDAKSSLPDKK